MEIYCRFGGFYDFGTPHSRDSSPQKFKIICFKFLKKPSNCSQRYSIKNSKFYLRRTNINQLKSYYTVIIGLRKLLWMG
jgi:hypothetical protein